MPIKLLSPSLQAMEYSSNKKDDAITYVAVSRIASYLSQNPDDDSRREKLKCCQEPSVREDDQRILIQNGEAR